MSRMNRMSRMTRMTKRIAALALLTALAATSPSPRPAEACGVDYVVLTRTVAHPDLPSHRLPPASSAFCSRRLLAATSWWRTGRSRRSG
jgi:hypothetical protein